MIIIPDVHGRTFWKDAVTYKYPEEYVVFLGDYLDPYPYENISREDAIENFKEILKYIKENKNTTVALLGNHDCMTYLSLEMGNCRTDFENAGTIGKLFNDNLDLFKIAWIYDNPGDTKYIFSHSALLEGWFRDNCMHGVTRHAFFRQSDTVEDIVESLNWALKKSKDALWSVLDNKSWIRGGYDDFGSIVWADLSEVPRNRCMWPGYHMIFGHSQQQEDPVLETYWSCLDCRKAFRLTQDGEIIKL